MKYPVGIMADSLRIPVRDAIIRSAELGANGVQLYAVGGEFCFENMPDTKRSDYKMLLKAHGLVISALCAQFEGPGFMVPALNRQRIRESLDMVIEAFNKQLARLYEDDALDITTDIDVLETMLKQDGLIDSGLRTRTSTGEEK